jgi:hypothetical protein
LNWSRLRLERLEVWFVRVVAVGAKEIALMPVPIPGSAAVDPRPPIPVLLPMALATEPVGLLKGNQLPAGQMQLVPVPGIVAIQAPPVVLVMFQVDLGVERQLPASAVGGHHLVAGRAREDPGGEGGRGYLHPLPELRR